MEVDDELWQEVERMAQAMTAADSFVDQEPTQEQIDRFCRLFAYTPQEATQQILSQRRDLLRPPLSSIHWSAIRTHPESRGHDRESYQHQLQLADVLRAQSATIPGEDGKLMHLVRLGGVLGTREEVMMVAGLSGKDEGEGREVEGYSRFGGKGRFVVVGTEGWKRIQRWLEAGMKPIDCRGDEDNKVEKKGVVIKEERELD